MSFSHTISAILRGPWLIDKSFAESQLPFIMNLLNGKTDAIERIDKSVEHKIILATAQSTVVGVSPYTDLSYLPHGSIAVVRIHGAVLKHDGLCSHGMLSMANLITRLSQTENVRGTILDVDSPGGQAQGTALLADAIRQASKRKPILSHISDGMAASAAMWFGTASTEVYAAQKTDKFGSIGVYTTIADWKKHYAEMFSLDVKDIYAPQSTDKNKDYNDAIAGDETAIKEHLSALADQFISTIQTHRAGKLKSDDWKTGKMFFAKDAIKMGLIDGMKTFDEVVARVEELSNNKKSKSKTMAFEKTLAIANAENFEVVDGGFLLSEENLNAIEAHLNHDASSELATANDLIALQKETINANVQKLATQDSRIRELEAEVAAFGEAASGDSSALITKQDQSNSEKKVPSYLRDDLPSNAYADKQLKRKKTEA